MAMHFGILAAGAPMGPFVAALQQQIGGIAPGERRGTLEAVHPDDDADVWHLGIGERDGATYLCDISSMVSADADVVVETSRLLQATVVGCGAETGSGTFWFYAARGGTLLHGYWMCFSSVDVPWLAGTPLPDQILEEMPDPAGAGLMKALRSVGFDYEAWARRSDLSDLIWVESEALDNGPLATQIRDYERSLRPVKPPKKGRFGFLGR